MTAEQLLHFFMCALLRYTPDYTQGERTVHLAHVPVSTRTLGKERIAVHDL